MWRKRLIAYSLLLILMAGALYSIFSRDLYLDGWTAGYMRARPNIWLVAPGYRAGYETGKKDRSDISPLVAALKKYGFDRRAVARELKLNETQFEAYLKSLGIRDWTDR
jgi:hypothetical protein